MKNKLMMLAITACFAAAGLSGCVGENENPDFSGYKQIADLATLECTFHNVAEVYNPGTDILFGINVGYKKAWFEYDGIVKLGIDVSKMSMDVNNSTKVVTFSVPQPEVLSLPDADASTFTDIVSDTGLLTEISTVDQTEAYSTAQEQMKKNAESDTTLMNEASERAKTLLSQYVMKIGEAMGTSYEVKFVDV